MDAETLLARATALAGVGRVAPALALTDRALRAARGPDLRARTLLLRGFLVAETDSADAGLAQLDEAAALTGLDRTTRARIEGNRGLVLHRLGRPGALGALGEALHLLGDAEPALRGTALLNRGSVHDERGEVRAAKADYELALALARTALDDDLAAMASANLSRLLLREGAVTEALDALAQVEPFLSRLSGTMAAKCLANRAEILVVAGLFEDAVRDLERSADMLGDERHPREQGDTEAALARVLFAAGDAEAAAAAAGRATRRLRARGVRTGAARARRVALQARLAGASTPRAAAAVRRDATRLAEELERLADPVEARRARLVAVEAALRPKKPAALTPPVRAALRLRRDDSTLDRLWTRDLRARLAEAEGRGGDVAREHTAAVAELQAHAAALPTLELRVASSVHLQRVARHAVRRAVAAGRPRQVLRWVERTRALSSTLPRLTPGHGAGVAPDTGTVRVDDVVAALSAQGTTTVCVADVDGDLLGVVVTGARARLVWLGDRAEVVRLARRVRADLDVLAGSAVPVAVRAVVRDSLAAGLDALAGRLVRPLGGTGDGAVAVAPAAALALVPWSLLPGLVGRPLSVSSTLRTFARRQGPLRPGRDGVAALAGPDLPHAAEELRGVASAWQGRVTVLPEAGPADALAATGRDEVVHVAAHGVHRPANPLFSHLVLHGGALFGHQVQALASPPAHVVLSACELGCAEVRPGDERLGMTAALLAGGVGSVVAGVAKVADDVSAAVAVAHHAALAAGRPPAEALALAVAAVPHEAAPAPFLCFGAGW
ncbi:CHAT domain-containing protein [Aquipuribacter sp. SD81]|uniref:CHAT domain-containing protein n=1 Tax=Aquipuribacter sp. SD81 TaxID=3127703 RepID=UPI00301A03AF